MSEWQPIETAPKDKTAVLIYRPSRSAPDWEIETASFVGGAWKGVDGMGIEGATHWMPLPSPPKAG